MIIAEEKIKQRVASAADEPSAMPAIFATEIYSPRELFLRRKFAGPPRGATPGPMDPTAKSGWQRMQDGERGKQRFTAQNHRLEKGDKL